MSDAEEETPQVAAAADPAPGEPMDVNTAVQLVLKKALAHDGVSRGLNETARALEKGEAQLAILADDCNQPDYKKLVEALCKEHGTPLLSVPEAKQLGQWAGLCKIDAEGEARRIVGCSSVVITDYGEETAGLAVLQEHLKSTDLDNELSPEQGIDWGVPADTGLQSSPLHGASRGGGGLHTMLISAPSNARWGIETTERVRAGKASGNIRGITKLETLTTELLLRCGRVVTED